MTNAEIQALVSKYTLEHPYNVLVGGELDPATQNSENFEGEIEPKAAFKSYFLTIIYTTLTVAGDDGACQITGRIYDQGRSIYLMSADTPINLFAAPGRQRQTAIAGDPSHTLIYPFPYEHTWLPSSKIVVESKSTADAANEVFYLFSGEQLELNYEGQQPAPQDISP